MTNLTSGVGLLERAIGYALGGLRCVTPEIMSAPTPCVEWDLRMLLHHVNDSLAALHEAVDRGSVAVEGAAGPPGPAADPVAAFRHHASRVLGTWVGAGTRDRVVTIADCPLTATMVAGAGSIEIAVHGWDIYQACRRPQPIPPALAADLLAISPIYVAEDDRPSRFAAPVPVPATDEPSDRLVAFLGRTATAPSRPDLE
jgi:uncharacterized protein (TIGR03086 family)